VDVSLDKVKRVRKELLIYVIPSFITTLSLFSGFFSIISSIKGLWLQASAAIIVAGFFDGLDGRVARMTGTESRFGEEYDSMSDLVAFGVAPAILVYMWALQPFGRIGWLLAFFYLACAALRLTRFNVLKQSTEKKYFQGLPTPLAAGTIAAGVMFYAKMDLSFFEAKKIYILTVLFVIAASMISTTRYRSFKDLKVKSQKGFGILMLFVLLLILIAAEPTRILFPLSMSYVLIGHSSEGFRFLRRRFSWMPGKGRT